MIRLDIISDPICPWCYIGKTRLDQALKEAGETPFDIHWRPFQLNPDMPSEGMDRREYLEAKFGKDQATAFYGQIESTAKASGLDVHFEKIEKTPNTIDAHRLLKWAESEDCQNNVAMELFRRYFEEGQDISDHTVLADAAEAAGMDREVITRLLASDNDKADIAAEDKSFREMGVQGVPCFIIGGKYVVNGAQEPALWAKVLKDLKEAAPA